MSEANDQPAVIEMRGARVTALRDSSLVVLDDVNWTVLPGEFWVVAGPPYSGKSDLLMHAAALIAPVNGTCRLFGHDNSAYDDSMIADRLRVGCAMSDGKLFNQYTVAGNVALPLRYHKNLPEAEVEQFVGELLKLLELTPFADQSPVNVTTSWRQRTALARALVLKPELLLLDNPNGGLVARHRRWLVDFLEQLWRGHSFFDNRPMTVVITTDDLQAWQHPRRKFAAMHEGKFSVLGAWGGQEFARHHVVQDFLSQPSETMN